MNSKRLIKLIKLPKQTSYPTGWKYQKLLNEEVNNIRKQSSNNNNKLSGYLLFVEHDNVYTLGKGGNVNHIKPILLNDMNNTAMNNIYRVERGGEITWHGPGQLTIYPILDLYDFKRDLHWYLRQLEEIVIHTLSDYELIGQRLSDINTGVWCDQNKISAIGITASRWITMHGCAINVTNSLDPFHNIVPCGIQNNDYFVTTLKQELLRHKYTDKNNDNIITSGSDTTTTTTTSNNDNNNISTHQNNILHSNDVVVNNLSSSTILGNAMKRFDYTHDDTYVDIDSQLMRSVENSYLTHFSKIFNVDIIEDDVTHLNTLLSSYPHIQELSILPLSHTAQSK